MHIEKILEELKNVLNIERYKHSVNVMEMSARLAERYGVDVEKARLAGILHDCGKNYNGNEAREYIRQIGYEADEIELEQPHLLHGIIGEHLARVFYGVTDEEVLGAVRWHTTGKAGMTDLEKIVYIADYIEPSRSFERIEEIREAAFDDLDLCVVLCANSTIRYIIEKGFLLLDKTVETRNYSLMLIKNRSLKNFSKVF